MVDVLADRKNDDLPQVAKNILGQSATINVDMSVPVLLMTETLAQPRE
jgi:hypothetical protein